MNLPAKTKYLLFDMDGTLVDTEPVGPQNFVNQLDKHGKQPTNDELALFIKIWRRDDTDINQDVWLPEIARKYDIDSSPEDYLKEFYEMYVNSIIAAPALTAVDEFLKKMHSSGKYKSALVTASKRNQVEAVLRQHDWKDVFDFVVTAEDITKHKPDPEPFLVGMKKLGAISDECVVFEDSKNGVNSGKAAGCFVIGLRAGSSTPQELSNADAVVDNFSDINHP